MSAIKISTGIWQVAYNAENLPVCFVDESAKTVVECTYDYMGRRHTRKVSVNGTVSSYLRYMYRGYLQIAAIDAVSGAFRWFLFQNLTQPEATRPLAIRKDGAWYAYGWDLTRNVTEIFGKAGYLRTVYTYTPYGEATAEGDVTQPIQWSSEYNDEELGLVYYNYRHLNPHDGRWISRDPIKEQGGWNLYRSFGNKSYHQYDKLGLWMGLDDLVAMAAGAVIGVAGQLISDAVNRELSSWKDYGLAASAGAIAGEASLYGGPIVGGAVYGMSHALLKNYFSDEKKEWCNVAIDVAIEGTIGSISAPIAKLIKIPGLNSGRNSWSAVGKTALTKLKNGTIRRIRPKVIAKYSGSEFYNSLPGTTLSLPSTILSNGTLESSRIYSGDSNLPLMSQPHIPLEAGRSNPSLFSNYIFIQHSTIVVFRIDIDGQSYILGERQETIIIIPIH